MSDKSATRFSRRCKLNQVDPNLGIKIAHNQYFYDKLDSTWRCVKIALALLGCSQI